ncbi:thaumatin-like protein 1b [Phragmites australis]|uniref:thaumatin-like protein 1b n=1 Tax=Phragmites australis TaxID=29695 RepID=UPI002D77DFF2|nr:thaumatin-like protein 1b [Phragmites australis]
MSANFKGQNNYPVTRTWQQEASIAVFLEPEAMAAAVAVHSWRQAFAVLVLLLQQLRGAQSATFTIANSCGYTVWPGLLSSAGSAPLPTTGFALPPGASRAVAAPAGWSGRLWGRTLCAADATGRFACATGDCGSGDVQCSGGGAAPPATLAEFTLDGSGGLDFFDASLVDGYNLPMVVTPLSTTGNASGGGSSGKCAATGCAAELNGACPADLRVVATAAEGDGPVACRSACDAFGDAQYCCSGAYGSPSACRPSVYSEFFKSACPRAYSYAYDDATSTFTCAAGATDYAVTFCPAASTSVKSTGENPQAAGLPQMNDTMVYFGGGGGINAQASSAAAAEKYLVAVAVTAVALSALL